MKDFLFGVCVFPGGILWLALFLIPSCIRAERRQDAEAAYFRAQAASGVTWEVPGYKILANDSEYACGFYRVLGNSVKGGDAFLLASGGPSTQVNVGPQQFRLRLFTCERGRLLREITCPSFEAVACNITSHNHNSVEP